jgi:hypothetical protein
LIDLPGELIAYHLPNQPGWWAYRKLSNGHLLEVKLTREEWFELHERQRKMERDKIRELDNHPLNIAARTLLEKAKECPLPNEIALISLARFAFDEDSSTWDLIPLADWARSPGTMQKAIWMLEEEGVTPEDLLSGNLPDAAQLVLKHLLEE